MEIFFVAFSFGLAADGVYTCGVVANDMKQVLPRSQDVLPNGEFWPHRCRLLCRLPKLQTVVSARERIKELLRLAVEFFNQDTAFRELFIFDGRRLHDREMMMLTPGYTDFTALLDSLVRIEVPEQESAIVRSAMLGACEGLVRDLTLRERFGYPADFSRQQAEKFVSCLVDDLMPPV